MTRRIDPERYVWLRPIYGITRQDVLENKFKDGLYIYKPSQTGASVAMMLFAIWLCIGDEPLSIAYWFPFEKDMLSLVKTRFNPMLEDVRLKPYLSKPGRVDTAYEKQIGNSWVYFRYTNGGAQADAVPLNIGLYDEVRLMSETIIEQTDYRYASQDIVLKIFASTAGSPNDAMEKGYQNSNQEKWHTQCVGCDCETNGFPGLVVADLDPPEFCRYTNDHQDAEFYCKHTGRPLDPSIGCYHPHAPQNKRVKGYHYCAAVAHKSSSKGQAFSILEGYYKALNRKEYWNGTMARAQLDAQGALVSYENCDAAVRRGSEMGLAWQRYYTESAVYAGIDCRTEEIHVVIGTPDRLLWVEVIQGVETYERLEVLLSRYSISKALMDYQPHTSITLPFARRNKSVWLAEKYQQGPMIRHKKDQPFSQTMVADEVREQRMVVIDKLKSFKHSLGTFARTGVAIPDEPIWQADFISRTKERQHRDIKEEFLEHLRVPSIIHKPKEIGLPNSRQKVIVTGEIVEHLVEAGFDPHFAHAFNYYQMAIHLSGDESVVVLSTTPSQLQGYAGLISAEREIGGNFRPNPYGSRANTSSPTRICGNCVAEKDGYCLKRGFKVSKHDPACTIRGFYRPKI